MTAIDELQRLFGPVALGLGPVQPCIDWAITRLLRDEEQGDLEVVLLASATDHDEAFPLAVEILHRYLGGASTNLELAAGHLVVDLRRAYLAGEQTVASLEPTINALYVKTDHAPWLVMLSRNCEYATDMPVFREPFDDEFAYIAGLWARATSLADFYARYRPGVSRKHDVDLGPEVGVQLRQQQTGDAG